MDEVIAAIRDAEERTQPPKPFDLDDAMRRGRRRARRRRAAIAGAGLAAATAVGVGLVFGLAERPGPADPAPPAETPSPPPGIPGEVVERPDELISLFAAPQRPRDVLPDEVKTVANVDESTTRALGHFRDTRYWAALPKPSDVPTDLASRNIQVVCHVTVTAQEWESTTCGGWASPERLGPSSWGPSGLTAQLLPDGYRPSADQLAEWTFVGPNLAITDVRPDCPPLAPSVLPDGSWAGQPTLVSRESPDGPPAVGFEWTGPGSYVRQAVGDVEPPAPSGSDGEALTVRGADGRMVALSPGRFAVSFEHDGCAYSLELGPDLSMRQARAYARSF